MSMFGKKEKCSICSVNEGNKSLADGSICKACMKKCVPFIMTISWKQITKSRVKEAINAFEQNIRFLEVFQPTKKFGNYISFDDSNRLWFVKDYGIVSRYEDIISFELLEDGDVVAKGGTVRSIAKGVLLDESGLIAAGVTGKDQSKTEVQEFRIKVITRNEFLPELYINFLTMGTVNAGSITYNMYKGTAQRIITEFAIITDSIMAQPEQPVVSG